MMSKFVEGFLGRVRSLAVAAFREVFFIDSRSLAFFRIGLGLVLFLDFAFRIQEIVPFFTDEGVYPRAVYAGRQNWWEFSLHNINGTLTFNLVLLLIGALLSLVMVVGYRTRWITLLVWLLTLSAQNRNHLMLDGTDVLIRMMTFWAIFLPLSARWSIDNLKVPISQRKYQVGVSDLACVAILLQILFMYFFTALLKAHSEWRESYDAVYYALHLDMFTKPLGVYLRQFDVVTQALTVLTLMLEFFGPLLLLIPFRQQKFFRLFVPFAFIGFHLSLYFTMYLVLFPWICIVSWFLFLPSGFWDRLQSRWFFKRLQSWCANLFSRVAHVTVKSDVSPLTRRLGQVILSLSFLNVSYYNLNSVYKNDLLPSFLRGPSEVAIQMQNWTMFAPRPTRIDGWFVVDGRLKDGTPIDSWNGASPVSFEKPVDFDKSYRASAFWRNYLFNIFILENLEELQLAMGRFLCRDWDSGIDLEREPQKQLSTYKLYFMKESTPDKGSTASIEPQLLWEHDCFLAPKPTTQTSD